MENAKHLSICRYNPPQNPTICTGCEKGCLDKPPAAYINKDFEDAVKEMEKHGNV